MAAPGFIRVGSELFKQCHRFTYMNSKRALQFSTSNGLNILNVGRKGFLGQFFVGSAGMLSIYVGIKFKKSFAVQAATKVDAAENQLCASELKSSFKVSGQSGELSTTGTVVPWHFENRPTKQVIHNKEGPVNFTLYQYVTCPFCCKVRAYLDYYGINYNIVEVDSIRRTQTKWTKYPKVPVLVRHGTGPGTGPEGFQQLNDSSMIISIIQSESVNPEGDVSRFLQYYPTIKKQEGKKTIYEYPNKYFLMYEETKPERGLAELREEREWREWVDNNLVHTLSPNAYRTLPEAFQSFNWFSEAGDWQNSMSMVSRYTCIYLGAIVMWAIGGRLKRKYGLEDDVRLSLYGSINDWLDGIGPSRKFMGGDKPNLADLAVYGVMGSIEGCQAFADLCEQTKFRDWYQPMKREVQRNAGLVKTADS